MPLASSTQVRAARLLPSLVVLDFRNGLVSDFPAHPGDVWFARGNGLKAVMTGCQLV